MNTPGRILRSMLAAVVIPVMAACDDGSGDDIPWFGDVWNVEQQCWEPREAFEAPPLCDPVDAYFRSPDGECWYFGCNPVSPNGWELQQGCVEVPQDKYPDQPGAYCEG